jgi:hypothetical protein
MCPSQIESVLPAGLTPLSQGARGQSHEPTAVLPELRRQRDWTGSEAETSGGPGRAGPRSKMYRWSECQQATVTELFRNDS